MFETLTGGPVQKAIQIIDCCVSLLYTWVNRYVFGTKIDFRIFGWECNRYWQSLSIIDHPHDPLALLFISEPSVYILTTSCETREGLHLMIHWVILQLQHPVPLGFFFLNDMNCSVQQSSHHFKYSVFFLLPKAMEIDIPPGSIFWTFELYHMILFNSNSKNVTCSVNLLVMMISFSIPN